MAYTAKQLAALSGVSVRTLHFYDETGLLKPARHGTNGYRFYEEPQLLTLQQILFYRHRGDVVGPRHLHDQDEWIHILGGGLQFEVGDKRFRAGPGESVFIPRNLSHAWAPVNGEPKIIDVYQPAGRIEEFYRELGKSASRTFMRSSRLTSFGKFSGTTAWTLPGRPFLASGKSETDASNS